MPVWAIWTCWIFGIIAVISLIGWLSYTFRDEFILFEGICIIFDCLGEIASSIGDAAGDIDIGD